MMPNYLGKPFYEGGFPVTADRILIEGVSVEEMKLKYFEEKASAEEEGILKEFVMYYIGAPCFVIEFDNEAQKEKFKQMSLDSMLDLLLDAGIDPL